MASRLDADIASLVVVGARRRESLELVPARPSRWWLAVASSSGDGMVNKRDGGSDSCRSASPGCHGGESEVDSTGSGALRVEDRAASGAGPSLMSLVPFLRVFWRSVVALLVMVGVVVVLAKLELGDFGGGGGGSSSKILASARHGGEMGWGSRGGGGHSLLRAADGEAVAVSRSVLVGGCELGAWSVEEEDGSSGCSPLDGATAHLRRVRGSSPADALQPASSRRPRARRVSLEVLQNMVLARSWDRWWFVVFVFVHCWCSGGGDGLIRRAVFSLLLPAVLFICLFSDLGLSVCELVCVCVLRSLL